jgi:hypothetical protein
MTWTEELSELKKLAVRRILEMMDSEVAWECLETTDVVMEDQDSEIVMEETDMATEGMIEDTTVVTEVLVTEIAEETTMIEGIMTVIVEAAEIDTMIVVEEEDQDLAVQDTEEEITMIAEAVPHQEDMTKETVRIVTVAAETIKLANGDTSKKKEVQE